MKILLVEDDEGIATMIRRGLEATNYQVDVASNGEEGLRAARSAVYSLLILDLMLPGRDGLSICRELRASRDRVPILMLTARDTIADRVLGFDSGADDYLPKPFDFQELVARVRALLRRDKMHRSRVIRVADLEIDTSRRMVSRAGREIGLSHREYDLLEALAAYEGQILTREAIQERIWMDEESASNTVDVYIGLLRKKVDAAHDIKLIQTVRGVGYTLRSPESEEAA